MSGIFHEGRWYEGTGMFCSICGNSVYESDIQPEYSYQCFHCDMDMYLFEAFERDGGYLLPVMVARPVGGVTLNEGLEYLLDDDGRPRIFACQREAEDYLLGHGITETGLGSVYFVEVNGEDDDEG